MIRDLVTYPEDIRDITTTTGPYRIRAGETVLKRFIAATSIALNVTAEEGLFKITGYNTVVPVSPTNANWYLYPNGNSYTDQFWDGYHLGSTFYHQANHDWNADKFDVGYGGLLEFYGYCSTFVNAKVCNFQYRCKINTNVTHFQDQNQYWKVQTSPVAWSSLGTLTFPDATTGYVIIERLV